MFDVAVDSRKDTHVSHKEYDLILHVPFLNHVSVISVVKATMNTTTV